jgi:hypothetical protein
MPRNTTRPEIMLALSPSATARALGIKIERVNAAIDAGDLIVRRLGAKRKIAVWQIQSWFESWPLAKRKVPR